VSRALIPYVRGAERFNCIERCAGDIEALLTKRGMVRDAVRVAGCFGYRQCSSPFCIRCASRRAYKQREHLLVAVPTLLRADGRYQVWHVTAVAADSPDVRRQSWGVVTGVRRLMKHDRLRGRVVSYFAALEIFQHSRREYPCAHAHVLVITRPMDKGKYRISRCDWIRIWEAVCPAARQLSGPCRASRVGANVSLLANHIPREDEHIRRVINYCTKWAVPEAAADSFRGLLTDPDRFIQQHLALRGVPRYFGDMQRNGRKWSADLLDPARTLKPLLWADALTGIPLETSSV